jgi:hypothetical protein
MVYTRAFKKFSTPLEKYANDTFIFNHETLLEYMKNERYTQELQNQKFRLSVDLFSEYGVWVDNLQLMYQKNAKYAKAELQNILNAFLKTTKINNQTPVYGTYTLPQKYRLPDDDRYTIGQYGSCLIGQKKAFKKFRKSIRDDNYFKEPTERRKKQLGYKTNWVYCKNYDYLLTYELHEDLNLHLHSLDFVTDTKEHVVAYIDLLIRKWLNAEIGRTVIKIDPKYKYIILEHLKLEKVKNLKKSHYDKDEFFLHRNTSDYKKFRSGAGFFIRFFDSSENLNEKITGYVCKYIFKTRSDRTVPLKDRINDDSLGYQHIFSLIGLRPFSFSLKTFAPLKLTVWRKMRHYLIEDDDRRKELFYLLREFKSGNLEAKVTKTENGNQIERIDLERTIFISATSQKIITDNAYQKKEYETRRGYLKAQILAHCTDKNILEIIS